MMKLQSIETPIVSALHALSAKHGYQMQFAALPESINLSASFGRHGKMVA